VGHRRGQGYRRAVSGCPVYGSRPPPGSSPVADTSG
jgi:hypothetical protein